jgi:hypothetical protein
MVPAIALLAVAGGLAAGGCGSDSSVQGATSGAKDAKPMKHEEAAMQGGGDGSMKHPERATKHNQGSTGGDSMKHEDSSSGDQMSH